MFAPSKPSPEIQSPQNVEVTLMGTTVLLCGPHSQVQIELNSKQSQELHGLMKDLPGFKIDSRETPLTLMGGRELWSVSKALDASLNGLHDCQVQSVSIGLRGDMLSFSKDGKRISLQLEEAQNTQLKKEIRDLLPGALSNQTLELVAHNVQVVMARTKMLLITPAGQEVFEFTFATARALHGALSTLSGFKEDSIENPIRIGDRKLSDLPRDYVPALRDLRDCEVCGVSVALKPGGIQFSKDGQSAKLQIDMPQQLLLAFVLPNLIPKAVPTPQERLIIES